MKNFLKITGIASLSIITSLYLAFLFVVPHVINLNDYKPQVQKLVKDNSDLTIDFDKVDVYTTPLLEAGIKTKNIKVTLPDGSVLLSAEGFKGKVFLPSLLWQSIRVSEIDINEPKLNIEIINSKKYKVAKVYEDLVNRKRALKLENPKIFEKPSNEPSFDPASLKIFVPALKLNNYSAVINDIKANHKLTLKGNQIKVGYFNGKNAKIKTDAEFFSDNDKNITLNLDIDSFIPNIDFEKREEDNEEVFELPFINPVSVYRDYNLKSDISSKIKVRKGSNDNKLWAKGNINVNNTTVTLANLELPKSHFNLIAKGTLFNIDTNIYATEKEYLTLDGQISSGKNPYIDLYFRSTQLHFSNLLNIVKAYLDTIHIKNDIENMSASGYMFANFKLKSDFRDLKSDGKFVIRAGNIFDNNIGLLFKDINANFLFDNNTLTVKDTRVLINDKPVKISGQIDADSVANLNIDAEKIPLQGLYKAFAPKEIKNAYDLNSGFLSLKTKITGEIKDTFTMIKTELEDFNFTDRKGKFVLTNKYARFGITSTAGIVRGKFKNNDFKFLLKDTNSILTDDLINADVENKKITINDSVIKLNSASAITFSGEILNYLTNPDTKIKASGILNTIDLQKLAGKSIAPYLELKGAIPVKATFDAKKNKMKTIVQLQSDANSYITPVTLTELYSNPVLLQLLAEKNGNNLKIYKSGFYLRKPNAQFRDNLALNTVNSKEIIGIRAMVSNFGTKPFINLFKINIPNELEGSICILPQSQFVFGGNLNAFGYFDEPRINGRFTLNNLRIPQWYTTIREIPIIIRNQDIKIGIKDLFANGSDFDIDMISTFNYISKLKLINVNIKSRIIDIDKILKVTDALVKTLPTHTSESNSQNSDIPIEILSGDINLKKITTGNIVVKDTTGRISLLKSILFINTLKTYPLEGNVSGNISVNLLNQEIKAKLTGKDFNIEKILLDVMNIKDTLSGKMNFLADISLQGTAVEEQMKSLKGFVDFTIKDGQLGPFGKFENFLMAENIRENAFFSSAIGSVITNIVTFDTSRFSTLFGHLTFDDGFASISPIKSQGNVMAFFILGKIGLVDNSGDLVLRGKLGSAFSDKLGPLANVNPVNLIKNTPGLNIVAAKTFTVFCEAVSEEEMNALPQLAQGKSDDYATKFQIKLKGDTRKPLKMVKSFKWLALNSEIESAQNFVDTIPTPEPGEEGMSVEDLIKLREEQAIEAQKTEEKKKSVFKKIKDKFKKE